MSDLKPLTNWLIEQLPDGYWKASRPDGTSQDNWQSFHDEDEAREFAVQQARWEKKIQ